MGRSIWNMGAIIVEMGHYPVRVCAAGLCVQSHPFVYIYVYIFIYMYIYLYICIYIYMYVNKKQAV